VFYLIFTFIALNRNLYTTKYISGSHF